MKRPHQNSLPRAALCLVLLMTVSQAQPGVEWARRITHNGNGAYSRFYDIFAQRDGGFAMCGFTRMGDNLHGVWLLTINSGGQVELDETYTNNNDAIFFGWGFSLIQ